MEREAYDSDFARIMALCTLSKGPSQQMFPVELNERGLRIFHANFHSASDLMWVQRGVG